MLTVVDEPDVPVASSSAGSPPTTTAAAEVVGVDRQTNGLVPATMDPELGFVTGNDPRPPDMEGIVTIVCVARLVELQGNPG